MPAFTVKPDAGTGAATVDGEALRHNVNETFATIRAGAGTGVDTGSTTFAIRLVASATSNQFAQLRRIILTLDTSVLSGATVVSATLVLKTSTRLTGLGTTSIELVAATPASNNNIVNGDYQQLGATSFASVAAASLPPPGEFLEIPLTGAALGLIDPSGITRLGLRSGWDLTGTFSGTWVSSAQTLIELVARDSGVPANEPYLYVVTLGPPSNTAAPAIMSSANVGFTTSVSTGTWDESPSSYGYQWRLETSASSGVYANISGATSSSYLIVSGDTGKRLYCVVTATNSAGSTAADSNITPALAAMPTNIVEAF